MNITATFLSLLAKALSGATVRWIESQPDACQRVYFANHTSHLDALVLWSSLPVELRERTRPVAAKDYWEQGWLRPRVARAFNALLIDRTKVTVRNSPPDIIAREIGTTDSVILFPEGTRGVDEMGEFKSGLFYLAKRRPDLELLPVYIDNLNRVLPRGEYLPVPLLSCITIGPPMWLETGEKKFDFLRRARDAVLRLREM